MGSRNESEVEIHQTAKFADDRVEIHPEDLAHAAVDDEVERAGETHEGVDDENNVVSDFIVQQFQINATAGEGV